MRTPFTDRYGCRHPFAGAGMAFACETPELAAAVCEAGGIGALIAVCCEERVPIVSFHWEEMPWLAGQGAGLVHEVRPAGRVVEQMMDEAAIVLARLQTVAAPAEVSS